MPLPSVPNTQNDRRIMLEKIGVASLEELFEDIPPQLRNPSISLPPSLSELELKKELVSLASRNTSIADTPCFLGGGAYRHFVPSVVDHITSRSEFYTAYTPYQPEISQGTLQTIFEFQSMICQITGMDVTNAGMYDGASAMAEGALMAARITGRNKVAILSTVNPAYRSVVETYAKGPGLEVVTVPSNSPITDSSYACVIVQNPNFFGCLEGLALWERAAHGVGALLLVSVDPISLGLLRPPGEYGADIVVGEGQPLGTAPSFGGPYLGLFACRQEYVRQMPGRIVGRTTDIMGRPAYVMTLQTREQHIRRERATSNICTSQALVALAATVYLAAMGPQGLRHVAELCYHKAHYAADQIAHLPGYSLPLSGTFFKEFVVRCPIPPSEVNQKLLENGIIGGLDVSPWVEEGMLLCVTEMNSRAEIDRLVTELGRI